MDTLQGIFPFTVRNFGASFGPCFGFVGLLALLIDFGLYLLLISTGILPGTAHVLSFFTATVFYYFFKVRQTFPKGGPEAAPIWRRPTTFFIIAFLALFLRGGVLATFTEVWSWSTATAILPAIGVGIAVTYLGLVFFVLPDWRKNGDRELYWRALTFGVVGYTLLLRFFYLGTADLLSQEAYYWNYAQHLGIGYLDHPPMVAWVIWLGTVLLGDTEIAVRSGAFLAWLVTAFFCFRLTRDLFDPAVAFRTLLFLAILPFFFGIGLVMTPDAPLVACWAGMLYFLERALLGGRHSAWWGAGICAGLGMLSKYTIALLGPAVLLFLLADRESRRWFLRPGPYGATLLALLLFTPVIIWNVEHQWASFAFQGSRRFSESLDFTLPALIGSIFLLLTPTGVLAAYLAMRSKPATGDGPKGADFIFQRRRRLFAIVFTLLPFLFFAAISIFRNTKLNWTGPVWLAVLPFMAWQMAPHKALRPSRLLNFLQRAWLPTIVATLLFFGGFLHYWVLGIPGLSYPKTADFSLLIGWKDFTKKIEQIREQVETSTGRKPFVVGMDKCYLTSQITFHGSKNSSKEKKKEILWYTAGRHLVGMDSLMYRFWFSEEEIKKLLQEDSILILVTRELHELKDGRIPASGWTVGEVRELLVEKKGLIIGRYYYALATPHGKSLPLGIHRGPRT